MSLRSSARGEALITQIANGSGVSPSALYLRMKIASKEDGVNPGVLSGDSAKLRESTRHIRLLEHEAKVMRRVMAYLYRDINPKKMMLSP